MKRAWCAALICILLLMVSPSRAAERPFLRYTSDYFGTVSMLCLDEEEGAEDVWQAVKAILQQIDESVSVSRADSDIARFNALPAGSEMAVSDCTAAVWRCAQEAYEMTGGLYDPTVYPLVDLWGFSPRFNQKVYATSLPYDRPLKGGYPAPPREEDISSLLPLVGMPGIALTYDEGCWLLRKNTPAVQVAGSTIQAQVDLGGIAKGYACDRVAALLRERGIGAGYFICGGSSMVFLARPDGAAYPVAAGKPRPGRQEGQDYASFSARNITLSTSSDISHGYWGADGVLYCHIIDPRTGYPLNCPEPGSVQAGAASVSLLADSAALGDALTTALCLMGPREALAFLIGREEKMVMAAYQSDADHLEVITNMAPEEMTILDAGYILASEREPQGICRYTGSFDPAL